jgi:hypothetical protein
MFPSASDEMLDQQQEEEDQQNGPRSLDFIGDRKNLHKHKRAPQINHDLTFQRETTPPYSGSVENLSSHDEILHLRKQVAKLNRRVLNVEIDNIQRQQREKVICCIGLAYFVLKTILWLNRK